MTPAVQVERLVFRYGRREVLHDLDLSVPEGCFCALLGPNGSGKTTLLRILAGMLRPTGGSASILGIPVRRLRASDRAQIAYVAEGQALPAWMRLADLEGYLAPFYPRWDCAFAASLRNRFSLDPQARIGTMSRGERMKAALLCALAPRPRLLLMDEPFTGMDAVVKDDIVRGVLESAGSDGWTVLVASHDIAEVEALADQVGVLRLGRLIASAPMDEVHHRFLHVDVMMVDAAAAASVERRSEWLSFARAGAHVQFIDTMAAGDTDATRMRRIIPGAARIDVRPATLREAFVAMVRQDTEPAAGGPQ